MVSNYHTSTVRVVCMVYIVFISVAHQSYSYLYLYHIISPNVLMSKEAQRKRGEKGRMKMSKWFTEAHDNWQTINRERSERQIVIYLLKMIYSNFHVLRCCHCFVAALLLLTE